MFITQLCYWNVMKCKNQIEILVWLWSHNTHLSVAVTLCRTHCVLSFSPCFTDALIVKSNPDTNVWSHSLAHADTDLLLFWKFWDLNWNHCTTSLNMGQWRVELTPGIDLWASGAPQGQASVCSFSCQPPCEPVPCSSVPPLTSSCCCGSLPPSTAVHLNCFEFWK